MASVEDRKLKVVGTEPETKTETNNAATILVCRLCGEEKGTERIPSYGEKGQNPKYKRLRTLCDECLELLKDRIVLIEYDNITGKRTGEYYSMPLSIATHFFAIDVEMCRIFDTTTETLNQFKEDDHVILKKEESLTTTEDYEEYPVETGL